MISLTTTSKIPNRKQILNSLDVHPTESAIILNYTVQSMRLGEDGQPVVADKKPMQKT